MPRLTHPVIGGFALVQEVPAALDISPAGGDLFTGEASHGEITIVHRVGPVNRAPGRLLVSAPPPMGRCWVDPSGNLALSNDAPSGRGEQVMLTDVDGHRYTLTHETAPAADYYQWLWQRAVFSYAVASRGAGVVAHATGLRLADGRTVLCPGISGTGKSTIARLLSEHGAERVTVLCDDRVFVRREAQGASAWGTPWHSEAGTMDPAGGPLSAILLLARGPGAEVRPLGPAEATPLLLRTLALPFWSDAHMAAVLAFLDDVLARTPVFELRYAPSPEAARVVLDELSALPASLSAGGGDW